MLFTPWEVTRSLILDDGHEAPHQNRVLSIQKVFVCLAKKDKAELCSAVLLLSQRPALALMVTEEIQKEEIKMLLIWASSHFSSPVRLWW